MYQYNRSCPCDRCRARGFLAPAILVTIGVLFLVGTITNGHMDFGRTWPVLLIIIGAVKLAQRSASTTGHIDPRFPGYVPVPPVSPAPTAVVPVEGYQPAPPPAPSGNEPEPPSSEVSHG